MRTGYTIGDFLTEYMNYNLFFARVKGKNDQFEVNAEPTLGSS